MKSESPQTVPLTPIEDLFCRLEEQLDGAGQAAIVVWLNGTIKADSLTVALRELQLRHPKLKAAIVAGAHGSHRYNFPSPPPPIPFGIQDIQTDEFPWRQEAHRLLQTGLAVQEGPPVAISVLQDRQRKRSMLILVAHHAVADGRSTIRILHDLLTAYDNAERGGEPEALHPLPLVSPTPPSRSRSPLGRMRMIIEAVRLWHDVRTSPWDPLPNKRQPDPYSRWVHWMYSGEETVSLMRRARQQRVSVSDILFASIACAIVDCLPSKGARRLKCRFAIDLRPQLQGPRGPVAPEDIGCYVTALTKVYAIAERPSLWQLARKAHEDVANYVRTGRALLGYHSANMVRIPKYDPRMKRATLFATDYGLTTLRERYGNLRPEACTLVFKNDLIGPSLIMESLILGGRLNVGFIGFDLDPEFWDQLQHAVRSQLDTAITSPTTT